MAESKRIYRISSLDVNEINRILGQLADRLDELEGFRGEGISGGHFVLSPFFYDSKLGTWEFLASTASWSGFVYRNSSNANGDYLKFKCFLAKGKYTLKLLAAKANNSGIINIDIDGERAAHFDLYNSTVLYNQIFTDANNEIAKPGIKTVTIRVNGKNTDSSGYTAYLQALAFYRTE